MRKITRDATRIKLGLQDALYLGNIDAKRDWGFAGDYVEAMWIMLQQENPDDYIVATGRCRSVRNVLQEVFGYLDLDQEKYVRFDQRYLRPTEVNVLQGDPTKARHVLGWEPKVTFARLCRMMVEADLVLAERERALVDAGHAIELPCET